MCRWSIIAIKLHAPIYRVIMNIKIGEEIDKILMINFLSLFLCFTMNQSLDDFMKYRM